MSREEEASWCTIESDPGIFSLLIEKLGVKGVQVEELYDLESSSLEKLKPIFGFIFLFKWTKKPVQEDIPADLVASTENGSEQMFFAQQEISNACATLAILHILLNSECSIDLGPVLSNFADFTRNLPADMRGLCLSNSLEVRSIHNEFGNLEEYLAMGDDDENESKKSKEHFHFVAFVFKNNCLFELDGLRAGPINHGHLGSSEEWPGKVLELIKSRCSSEAESSNIQFNLMALVSDKRTDLKKALESETDPSRKFVLQSDLEQEDLKWARYRKDWDSRKKQAVALQVQGSQKSATDDFVLSPQVKDLLNSLTSKGLFSK